MAYMEHWVWHCELGESNQNVSVWYCAIFLPPQASGIVEFCLLFSALDWGILQPAKTQYAVASRQIGACLLLSYFVDIVLYGTVLQNS